MAEQSSPGASASPSSVPTTTRSLRKRSYIACRRCHSFKVKCSGGVPCQRCQKSGNTSLCQYPPRVRRVTVAASYLQQLQTTAENPVARQIDHDNTADPAGAEELPLEAGASRVSSQSSPPVDPDLRVDSDMSKGDGEISNPVHEPERISALDQASREYFVGESTCLAFGDRILQSLNPDPSTIPLLAGHQYVRNPVFSRQLSNVASCKFPERIRASLLVRIALRFIGQDYHLFLHHDFLDKLDKAYRSGPIQECDSVWACKFFVILALGEMYSTSLPAAKEAGASSVPPGTTYFVTAVSLLQDLYEEPSVAQVETLLLFCFYSNILGRVKSAHMYSGMAVRSSTCLGLHRNIPDAADLSLIEQEHRVRLWWTVYIFDRSTCSKLGQPLTIQDTDIDVRLPSSDVLIPESQMKLGSPDHLIAYINLAQITGDIMRDTYGSSSKANGRNLVQNVRAILQKLRKWDAHVPARLRWNPEGGTPRSVASLQLHFNQCIILTTRPILLYKFKAKNPFPDHAEAGGDTPQISETIGSLADSCIAAARTSNTILSQLFVENALATCGYFDAHHLFASTLVLIMSAITSPNARDSDAVQTAFQLLAVMRDNGNAAAGEYFSRVAKLQWTVSRLFAQATATNTTPSMETLSHEAGNTTGPPASHGPAHLDEYDWSKLAIPPSFNMAYDETTAEDNITTDPLDNPFLQAFLDHNDASRDENIIFNTEGMDFAL